MKLGIWTAYTGNNFKNPCRFFSWVTEDEVMSCIMVRFQRIVNVSSLGCAGHHEARRLWRKGDQLEGCCNDLGLSPRSQVIAMENRK